MPSKKEKGAGPAVEFNGIHNDPSAPAGANTVQQPVAQAGARKKAEKPVAAKPGEQLYVVKDEISQHIHSQPMPKAKAEATLKRIEEKERREHPSEAQYEFSLVEA